MATAVTQIPMPQMGVSVEEGTITGWLKSPGDAVAEGDVLCEISTDKVDTEVTAPTDGVLVRVLADVGDTVPVGGPLAELAPAGTTDLPPEPIPDAVGAAGRDGGEPERAAAAPSNGGPTAPPRRTAGPATLEPSKFDPEGAAEAAVPPGPGRHGGARSSPVARRIAADHGLDLAALAGTGRHGRIRKADVLAALEAPARADKAADAAATAPPPGVAAPPPGEPAPSPAEAGFAPPPAAAAAPSDAPAAAPTPRAAPSDAPAAAPAPGAAPAGDGTLPRGYEDVPHEIVATSPQRRAIAEHMSRSRRTAAHMTTEADVDMTRVTRVRAELNAERLEEGRSKLSFLPFVARALCAALREFPDLNATFDTERLIRWRQINLGIAVDTDRGLIVPVIRGCELLNVAGIAEAVADLAQRARSRRLTADDLVGGTFTLSNPGSAGAVAAPAILNQPQVGLLGMPIIQKRAWVVAGPDGEDVIVPRPIMRLALTFDHRANDGAEATRCVVRVKDHLETWDAAAYA